tara:strand:+ start:1808 stop:2443 length:636 start_codon:yes stop_codon:yes gene_type:complete
MHQNQKFNVLCFGNRDFNSSIKELKDYLNFRLEFTEEFLSYKHFSNFQAFLFDGRSLENMDIKKALLSLDQVKIILQDQIRNLSIKNSFYLKIPMSLFEVNNAISESLSKSKFLLNSAVKVKGYILDKNERKLIKNNKSIILTEKEIQLLELLSSNKKAISKKNILQIIWQYSKDADTHTVETHVYRLRKKIKEVFDDNNFIINEKEGYLL